MRPEQVQPMIELLVLLRKEYGVETVLKPDGNGIRLLGAQGHVPKELIEKVVELKPAILEYLRAWVQPTTVEDVVKNLLAMQGWLKEADAKLGDDIFSDPELAEEMCVVLADWQIKERYIRDRGFKGCIWSPNQCPPDSVEQCFECRSHSIEA